MGRLSTGQYLALAITVPAAVALLYLLYRRKEEEQIQEVAIGRQKIVEVKVPREVIGSIIGRQGSNIKEIENKSGARLNVRDETFPRDGTEERVVIIRGKAENVQEAERLVQEHIAKQPQIKTVEITVPQRALGRIIGRNGDNIRSMCRISKARIKINRETDDRDPNALQTVTIKGAIEEIQHAKGLIEEKVAEEELFQRKLELAAANRRPRSPKPYKDWSHSEDSDSTPQRNIKTPAINKFVMSEGALPTHSDYFEVYVSAVSSAGHFWVQVLGQKSQHLDYLVETMTEYYSDPDNRQMEIAFSVDIGDIVSVPFKHDDDWYRARITKIEENEVSVYYVDFGDDGVIDLDKVHKLRSDFLSLPFQAMECFLANVEPIGDEWTEKATDDFENLTYCAKWKVLMAKILSYKQTEKGLLPCVELIDTNGPQDVNINQKMVALGYAVQSVRESPVNAKSSPKPIRYGGSAKGRLAMKFPPTDFDSMESLRSFYSDSVSGKYQERKDTVDVPSEDPSFPKISGAYSGSDGVKNGSKETPTQVMTLGNGDQCISKDVSQHATSNMADLSITNISASTPMRGNMSEMSSFTGEGQASPIYPVKTSKTSSGSVKYSDERNTDDSSSPGVLEITSSAVESSGMSTGTSTSGTESYETDPLSSMQDSCTELSVENTNSSAYSSVTQGSAGDTPASNTTHESDYNTSDVSHSNVITSLDDSSQMSTSLLLADVSSSETSVLSSVFQASSLELKHAGGDTQEPREISPVSEDNVSFKSALSVEVSSPETESPSFHDSSFPSVVSMDISSKSALGRFSSSDTPISEMDTTMSAGDSNSTLPPASDSMITTLETSTTDRDTDAATPLQSNDPLHTISELQSFSILPDSRPHIGETYSFSSTDLESYSVSSQSDLGSRQPTGSGTFSISSSDMASYSVSSESQLDNTKATSTTSGSYSLMQDSSSETTNSNVLPSSLDLSTSLVGSEVFSPQDESPPDYNSSPTTAMQLESVEMATSPDARIGLDTSGDGSHGDEGK
ncbi:serine-rich adhesin for platelets-like isoform X2 [Ptychodera flava]|uniref:serine-rich adhesin for platelets-like isoform X2 n=1 Tax=Ptychodera flava TaxID=63121 RepID=UPI00396A856D